MRQGELYNLLNEDGLQFSNSHKISAKFEMIAALNSYKTKCRVMLSQQLNELLRRAEPR